MSDDRIFGIHAVRRRLLEAPGDCLALNCQQNSNPRLLELVEIAAREGIETRFLNREQLFQLCNSRKHQGCVLEIRDNSPTLNFDDCVEAIHNGTLLLVLDGVQDPHNLGACLRSADACGVDAVIIPRDRSVKVNATVRKVAAGGAETVPVIEVTNLVRALEALKQKGVWVYGSSGDASESLYEHDFRGPVALVMGAEGSGLRRLTSDACDHLVKLPMRGRVESLNVSVATGVCLYQILRARELCKD